MAMALARIAARGKARAAARAAKNAEPAEVVAPPSPKLPEPPQNDEEVMETAFEVSAPKALENIDELTSTDIDLDLRQGAFCV